MQVTPNASFNYDGGAITLETWVKRANNNRIESVLGNGRSANLWLGISATGRISFTPLGSSHIIDGVSAIPANTWTHIAVVYRSNVSRAYYINGILDKLDTTPANNPSLANAAISGVLKIASDRDNMANTYNYAGQLDEIRIWSTNRSPSDILSDMTNLISGPKGNLAGAWNLDGSNADITGGNSTTTHGTSGVSYTTDGALPRSLSVPQVTASMTLDGSCGPSEYATSADAGIVDTLISVQHTTTDLWICLDNIGSGVTSVEVYLDPQFTKLNPPQGDHIRLTLPNSATTPFASIGDTGGGFITAPAFDSHWGGKIFSTGGGFPTYSAEFRIASDLVGGWEHQMGMAMVINGTYPGSWPSLLNTLRPVTWAKVSLLGNGASRTFGGSVVYHPASSGGSDQPVGNTGVNLIGYDNSGNEVVVNSATTTTDGTFSITTNDGYPNHRLEAGSPPKGMQYASATAGASGTTLNAHTIGFAAAGAGVYGGSIFKLSDAVPGALDTSFGPIYAVIATTAMFNSGALNDFIAYKSRLGFTMTTQSLEAIESTFTTGNRQDRIRAYEKSLASTYGGRFQYALFVGSTDVTMPPAHLWPYASYMNQTLCADPTQTAFKYSDWYFVDLLSDFDSNKNGCLMDGPWAKTPAAGYIYDTPPWFRRDVAVGRVPFDSPTIVRNVLNNSMNFERQSQVYKTKALLGMSMLAMKGYDSVGNPCTSWTANHCAPPTSTFNFDMSVLGNKMKNEIFAPLGFSVQAYYENDPTASGGVQIPGSLTIDPTAIQNDLNTNLYGFINFDGHGNSAGVYRVNWTSDSNSNGKPNWPNEMGTGNLFTTTELANISPKNGQGGIYYLSACTNADPNDQGNLPYSLLSNGVGVAAIAAYNIITVNAWTQLTKDGLAQNTDYRVTQAILTKNLLLGDALWKDLSDEISGKDPAVKVPGSGLVGMGLFGDPTLSYQGNPGAGSAQAPWSMIRRESTGQSYFPLPGPETPNKLWEFLGNYVITPPESRTSPVVGANGDVIVSSGSGLTVLTNGTVYQTLTFDYGVPNYGMAALGADGTVYAADNQGHLFAYSIDPTPLGTHHRTKRWKINLGGSTRTNPIIAPDGSILIGYSSQYTGYSNMAIIRPDGTIQQTLQVLGTMPQVAASVGADRAVYVVSAQPAENKGYVLRFDPFCNNHNLPCNGAAYTDFNGEMSTAPLLANGYVYAGDKAGNLYQLDRDLNLVHSYNVGSQITVGPVSGPGGQVVIGTMNGKIFDFTANLAKRWSRLLTNGSGFSSVPAFSDNALYVAGFGSGSGYLWALNPNSGSTIWKRAVEDGSGSVSIGYGRQLFFQSTDPIKNVTKVTAFGENWTAPVFNIAALATKLDVRPRNVIVWSTSLVGVASLSSIDPAPQAIQSTITGLLLERSIDGQTWEMVALLPPGTTSYIDSGVTPEAGYQYRVQVLDSTGDNSDYATSETIDSMPLPPSAPVLNSATPISASEVQLDWSAPANSQVLNYRIESSTSLAGTYTAIQTVPGGAHTYLDSGLSAASQHFYRVVAINANTSGAPSNVISATTFSETMSAPSNPSAALQPNSSIHITWGGRPAGAKAVVEVRIFGSDSYQVVNTVDADSLDFTPDIANTYGFRIRFVKGTDQSPYADTTSVDVPQLFNYSLYLPTLIKP